MASIEHQILKRISSEPEVSRQSLYRHMNVTSADISTVESHLIDIGAIESFRRADSRKRSKYYRMISDKPIHNIIEIHCASCGIVLHDDNISNTLDKNGYELCNGCGLQLSGRTCRDMTPTQFGTDFAETALSKAFKDVVRAPNHNPGYDFICNSGKKIDVKASCINIGRQWTFSIKRNQIADYFLLVAFNNRSDLVPMHAWMIPGNVLNNLQRTSIGKRTISKWNEYRIPIDNITKCCKVVENVIESCDSMWVLPVPRRCEC